MHSHAHATNMGASGTFLGYGQIRWSGPNLIGLSSVINFVACSVFSVIVLDLSICVLRVFLFMLVLLLFLIQL